MRVFPLVAITLAGLICVSGKTIEKISLEEKLNDRLSFVFTIFNFDKLHQAWMLSTDQESVSYYWEDPEAATFEDEWGAKHHYFNLLDKELNFECPDGEFVYKIRSTFDHETHADYTTSDRQWWFDCHSTRFGQTTDDPNNLQNLINTDDCAWSEEYENDWRDVLDFHCPDHGIITGFHSYHSNNKEDRRWKFRCCKPTTYAFARDCRWDNYIDYEDEGVEYNLDGEEALVGLWSALRRKRYSKGQKANGNGFSNDRDWKVKVCKFLPFEYEESGIVNSLDDPLMYHCPYGMHIFNIKSYWSDNQNDRRWEYHCQTGLLDERADRQECHTDIEINDFKETPIEYNCNENEVIVGFESYHWNSYEDRKWSVKCCKVKEDILKLSPSPACVWSDEDSLGENFFSNVEYFNMNGNGTYAKGDWNVKLLETSRGFAGFKTEWSNEDRKWKFKICNMTSTSDERMILPQPKVQLPAIGLLAEKNPHAENRIVDWTKETYQNDWDGDLDFECPEGQHVARIRSEYDGGKNDRRWWFGCQTGEDLGENAEPEEYVTSDCYWTTNSEVFEVEKDAYANDFKEVLNFNCPNDDIISGAWSHHWNSREDRRWRFKCCKPKNPGRWCRWTTSINNIQSTMNYPLVEKEAIVGLWSWYRDASDDRYWKVKVCDFGQHEYANEGYMNEYDNSLMYKCPYGMHIYKIGTSFDSGDNDRRWRFYCRSGLLSNMVEDQVCSQSDWINSWEGNIGVDGADPWICPANQVMVGFESHHSNDREDRRWNVSCCQVKDDFLKTDSISDSAELFKILSADTTYKEQGWTPYSSGWEVYVDNARAAFIGLRKTHSGNKHEDSKWKWASIDY